MANRFQSSFLWFAASTPAFIEAYGPFTNFVLAKRTPPHRREDP
jgi:hypothetical protein